MRSLNDLENEIIEKCKRLIVTRGIKYLYYGNLHIILADGNTERWHIESCKKACVSVLDIAGVELCDLFLYYLDIRSPEQLERFIFDNLDECELEYIDKGEIENDKGNNE